MNILYIGPYRQYDYIGQQSLSHLSSIEKDISKIKKQVNLTCRPVYVDPSLREEAPNSIRAYENNIQSYYDVIIQYLPISYLCPIKISKNIAIPIVSSHLYNSENHENLFSILDEFDWVFLDDANTVKRKNKTNNILYSSFIDENTISSIQNKKYNIGYANDFFKFGFVGLYKYNKNIINTILLSFLTAFRNNDNVNLLFCLIGTEEDQKEIAAQYNKIKESLKINNQADNISILFNKLDLMNSMIAINTFDCLLSLNDDIKYTFYEKAAAHLNKKIISRATLELNSMPQEILVQKNDFGYCTNIKSSSLIDQMLDRYSNNSQTKSRTNQYPDFGNTICKIL